MSSPVQNPLSQAFDPLRSEKIRFIVAGEQGQFETMKAIITKHPEAIRWTNDNGTTALHRADRSFAEAQAMARWLVSRGADVNRPNKRGYTPLHCAAGNGGADTISLLAAQGANLEAVNDGGDTPLLHAIRFNRERCIMVLAICGANVEAKGSDGQSAFDLLRGALGEEKALHVRGLREAYLEHSNALSPEEAMEIVLQGLPSKLKIKKPLQLKNRI